MMVSKEQPKTFDEALSKGWVPVYTSYRIPSMYNELPCMMLEPPPAEHKNFYPIEFVVPYWVKHLVQEERTKAEHTIQFGIRRLLGMEKDR